MRDKQECTRERVIMEPGEEKLPDLLASDLRGYFELPVSSFYQRAVLSDRASDEQATGEIHWRSITWDNVTTLYGKDDTSRIFYPTDPITRRETVYAG
jgi:hypothetical protein